MDQVAIAMDVVSYLQERIQTIDKQQREMLQMVKKDIEILEESRQKLIEDFKQVCHMKYSCDQFWIKTLVDQFY